MFDSPEQSTRPSTYISYIASVEGKKYRVKVEDLRLVRSTDLSIHLYIDGTRITKDLYRRTDRSKAIISFWRISSTMAQEFTFAKVALTDDDELATTSESIVRGIGTISVQIHRVQAPEPRRSASSTSHFGLPSTAHLHESSKKAQISHQTAFAGPMTVTRYKSVRPVYLDPLPSPSCTFEVRYRSRHLLEIESIAPETKAAVEPEQTSQSAAGPSNPALNVKKRATPSEVIIIDSSDEEAENDKKSLAAEIRRLKAENAALKAQNKKPRLEGST